VETIQDFNKVCNITPATPPKGCGSSGSAITTILEAYQEPMEN
jgi:hypothetical protein